MATHASSTRRTTSEAARDTSDGFPAPRTIRRALNVVLQLPTEALADVGECIIDRLNLIDGDPDLEPDEDYCEADDLPAILRDLGR